MSHTPHVLLTVASAQTCLAQLPPPMANKRPLTPPSSSSSLDTPTPKAARTSLPPTTNPLLFCTLPPTCHPPSNRPTPLKDARELEAHYAKYHAHVCEVFGCMSVFPDARTLDLVRDAALCNSPFEHTVSLIQRSGMLTPLS